ncbi:hypothetical protein GCM10010329_80820 [Streptomyces spiroverticillatus]|uniref:Uncharacterized protein n=1 Tax=Streptomyces finlayi TaxID=67296 RepID=A0A919CER3_9ACTN|nr:hypothetical protein [Streptomyces finlayi]GHA46034.1 hypothetical protein GCM10010329_80820 [Streptomyces spiroverticillatus]GHD16070.1 hypothetical protein GCM10010334_76740 [Streptomyces finlayi]
MRDINSKAHPAVRFNERDFVLYRDPALFWTGQEDHTFVCRVQRSWNEGTYDLLAVATNRFIHDASGDYMRLLPSLDAMRDIDTAPLHSAGAADGLTAAALAWLTQQHATANRCPELPAPRG